MPTPNQPYWMKGNWGALAAGSGNAREARYYEDIRKLITGLNIQFFGLLDPSAGLYEFSQPPSGSIIYKYKYDWLVTTEDPNYGWLWWRNKNDIYKGETILAPPADIHPDRDLWVEGSYSAGDIVGYPYAEGNFYQAGENISGDDESIPPPQNPTKWTKITNWYLENIDWILVAGQKFAEYDTNSQMMMPVTHIYDSGVNRDEVYLHPSAFLPKQFDKKLQLAPVRFADTGQKGVQYKGVVIGADDISSLLALGLGPVWEIWNRFYHDDNNPMNIINVSNYEQVSCVGFQYANKGGLRYNLPTESDYPVHYNPKLMRMSYQSSIEVTLESADLCQPLSEGFESTFVKINFSEWSAGTWTPGMVCRVDGIPYTPITNTTTAPPGTDWRVYNLDESTTFDTLPPANHHCRRCNESSFEFFKKETNKFDYYLDTSFAHVPSHIVRAVYDELYNKDLWPPPNDKTLGELKEYWDLDQIKTWRWTWMYLLGRLSPWMRSMEMGEPTGDTWEPTASVVYGGEVYDSDSWPGIFKKTYPAISEFDTDFLDITKVNSYTLQISGDQTSVLKKGWMVHLCSNTSDLIHDETGWMSYGYIISISYDSGENKTTIRLSCEIDDETKIGFNPDISERHDPIYADYDKDGMLQLGFKIKSGLLLEMKEVLEIAQYLNINEINITTKFNEWQGDTLGQEPSSLAAAIQSARADAKSKVDLSNPESGAGWVGGISCRAGQGGAGGWYYVDDEWKWLAGASAFIAATAFKITWNSTLIEPPDRILVRIAMADVAQDPPTNTKKEQSVMGIYNSIIALGEPATTHYRYLEGQASNQWHILYPDIVFPDYSFWTNEQSGYDYTEGASGEGNMGFAGITLGSGYGVLIHIDWEDFEPEMFDPNEIGHIDVPHTPVTDDKPPTPNPPVNHIDPYMEFAIYDGENDPEGESPPYFKLKMIHDICLCHDLEGNGVRYRSVGKDSAPTAEWTEYMEVIQTEDYDFADLIGIASLENAYTTNPSGTVTRVYDCTVAGDIKVDTPIYIKNGTYVDGRFDVTDVGTDEDGDWFEFDSGHYSEETFGSTVKIFYSKMADDEFAELPWADYEFAPQTRDNASPTNNYSNIGEYKTADAPDVWPIDLWLEAISA